MRLTLWENAPDGAKRSQGGERRCGITRGMIGLYLGVGERTCTGGCERTDSGSNRAKIRRRKSPNYSHQPIECL